VWFQDALNHDPGNAGLQRLIDLSEYTEKRAKQNRRWPAASKPVSGADTTGNATIGSLDRPLDGQMDAGLARALDDFNRNYLPKHPGLMPEKSAGSADRAIARSSSEAQKANWSAFFNALFVTPPRTSGVAAVRD
jgi:hypothetical protein